MGRILFTVILFVFGTFLGERMGVTYLKTYIIKLTMDGMEKFYAQVEIKIECCGETLEIDIEGS